MILKEALMVLKEEAQDLTDLKDGMYLLAHCLGGNDAFYAEMDLELSEAQHTQFKEGWRAYLSGKPLAYLIGTAEFWSFELKVTPDVLIPRPDTETLVRAALALPLAVNATVLEWGTGSGAIALALKKERVTWGVTALDISPEALKVAQHNRETLQLEIALIESEGFKAVPQQSSFDLIVSNPPYVTAAEWEAAPSLAFEPYGALVAPDNGLSDLKSIIEEGSAYLNTKGYMMLEHGATQADAVAMLFAQAGYHNIVHHKDYAGHTRVTAAQKP